MFTATESCRLPKKPMHRWNSCIDATLHSHLAARKEWCKVRGQMWREKLPAGMVPSQCCSFGEKVKLEGYSFRKVILSAWINKELWMLFNKKKSILLSFTIHTSILVSHVVSSSLVYSSLKIRTPMDRVVKETYSRGWWREYFLWFLSLRLVCLDSAVCYTL